MINIVDNLVFSLMDAKTDGERIMVLKAIRDYLGTQGFHASWNTASFSQFCEKQDTADFSAAIVESLIVPYINHFNPKEMKALSKKLGFIYNVEGDTLIQNILGGTNVLSWQQNVAYWILYTVVSKMLSAAQNFAINKTAIVAAGLTGNYAVLAMALIALVSTHAVQGTFNVVISDTVASSLVGKERMSTKEILFWTALSYKKNPNKVSPLVDTDAT